MSDKEVVELIATEVMKYVTNGNCDMDLFSPLTNDEHCMEAWDKFSEKRWTSIEKDDGGWIACWNEGENHIYHDGGHDKDRRRAMCKCMVKAVLG